MQTTFRNGRPNPHSLCFLLASCCVATLMDAKVQGQVNWNNAGGGNYSLGSNWTGGFAPTTIQDASFSLGGQSYAITFNQSAAAQKALVTNGNVNFVLGGNTYTIGDLQIGRVAGQTGNLLISDGSIVTDQMQIGTTSSVGNLTIGSGGRLVAGNSLNGIFSGSALSSMQIANGGQFIQEFGSFRTSGASTIEVNGHGSLLRFDDAFLGESGSNTLNISNGGTLESNRMLLASQSGSSAQISVGGSSVWSQSGRIDTGLGTCQIVIRETGLLQVKGFNADINLGGDSVLFINNAGELDLQGEGLGNGINLIAGATLAVTGQAILNVSSTGIGSGINTASGSTLFQNGGSIVTSNLISGGTLSQISGSLAVNSGVFDNNSNVLSSGGSGAVSFSLINGASTNNLTGLFVGSTNTAFAREFNVLSGSTLTTTGGSSIGQLGSGSLVRVSGAGSRWNSGGGISVGLASGALTIENGGAVAMGANSLATGILGAGSNGIVTIQSGGRLDSGVVELARIVGSQSAMTVTGTGSQLNSSGLFVGGTSANAGGTASMTIADGAAVTVSGTTRVRTAGTMNLNGGSLTTQNFTRDSTGVFNFGGGTLTVQGNYANTGGTVTLAGAGVNDNSTLVLQGNANTSGITDLNIGSASRLGTLTMNAGSQLNTGNLTIGSRGAVNLNGGGLVVSNFGNGGVFNWNSGAVIFNGSSSLGSSTLSGLLGSTHNLKENQTLGAIGGTMTLDSTLNVNGGTLSPINLTNNSTLTLNQGNVAVAGTFNNNVGRTVQVNGVSDFSATTAINNSGTIRMNGATASLSGGDLNNLAGGTISGSGQINNDLFNAGIIRVASGEQLVIAGSRSNNAMNMILSGGTLEFTNSLSNRTDGAIFGRGTLIGSSANPGSIGLENNGLMSFSAGTTDIFGDVDQTTEGRIVTSGGGTTTFFDDVSHNGLEIRTFAGSRTVFLGDQTGAGNFTGTGTVEYAGDLRPGNSPAVVSYGGDVIFNDSTNLFVELGGLSLGQFDQLNIAGNFLLDGNLFVKLINGHTLGFAEQYLIGEIGGSLIGQFNGLGEGSLFGNFGGQDLFVSYQGGSSGNGVVLFTAVPEPVSCLFLTAIFAGSAMIRRRKK